MSSISVLLQLKIAFYGSLAFFVSFLMSVLLFLIVHYSRERGTRCFMNGTVDFRESTELIT